MCPETPEVWKPVVGFEDAYEVSSQGRVRSIDRVMTTKNGIRLRFRGVMRKPVITPGGYPAVGMGAPNYMPRTVHVLVCEAFHGPKPKPGMVVRHLNGVSTDNRPENLAWGTHSENNFDLVRHGTHWKAAQTQCKWGHEFNEENTYFRREGGRRCRTCKRLRQRKRAA